MIGKRISIAQVEQFSAWCREVGIRAVGGYIISLPDETVAGMRRTLALMRRIGDPSGLNILRIYPGTRIEQIARERGVLPAGFSWAEEKALPKDILPALSGPVPFYIEGIPWYELEKALFSWASDNRLGLMRPLILSLKGLRSLHDVLRLMQFGRSYLAAKCFG